ncbi:MAG: glycosyltransferase [Deltaproteobacteria bacterium]|nr:glycosyltransferase [Deltaproteobacteria bacterium]
MPALIKPAAGPGDAAAGRREDVKVDVCVLTYRRPQSLMRLLGALQELRFPDEPPALRVVVVDNDPEGSAREVCEDARSWLSAPLVYIVEKRRGIPQARNAALAASLAHSHFLAFADDDEVPEPDWLAELLRVQHARNADAVAGPVLPRFEPGAARWLTRGGLFERPRHATGARIDTAYTCNVLVRTAALAQMDALFDERLALSGGSDSEFFERFAASGRRIVWADTAVVHEWVPASRLSVRWLLARAFRVGCASAGIERRRVVPRRSRTWHLANGCWCILKGALLLGLAALRGRVAAVRALRLVWYGAGRLHGLRGFAYEEYRTIHVA